MFTVSLPVFLIAVLVVLILGMKSAKQTNRQDKAMQDAVQMNVVRTYMESLTDQSEQIKGIEEKLLWLPEKVVDQIEHKQTMKIKDREDALTFISKGAPVEISELAKYYRSISRSLLRSKAFLVLSCQKGFLLSGDEFC